MSIITDPSGNNPISGASVPGGLPDVQAIEKLANELFSALPAGMMQGEIPQPNFSPHLQDHPRMEKMLNIFSDKAPALFATEENFNVNNPQTSLPDPHLPVNPLASAGNLFSFNNIPGIFSGLSQTGASSGNFPSSGLQFPGQPSAASGAGISPSSVQTVSQYSFGDPNSYVNDPATTGGSNGLPVGTPFAGSGVSPSAADHLGQYGVGDTNSYLSYVSTDTVPKDRKGPVPQSVAGSGASPSGVLHGNEVNPDDPQTSHVDPHAGTGKVPSSVAGSGISPSFAGEPFDSRDNTRPDVTSYGNTLSASDLIPSFPYASGYPDVSALNQSHGIPGLGNFSQLPVAVPRQSDASFYFLSDRQPASYRDNFLPDTFSPFSLKSFGPGYGVADPGKSPSQGGRIPFDVNLIKKDFPILQEKVNGHPLVWLDNAATTQKPRQVIERVSYFYEHENSNIHRAAHELAARATDAYEGAREKVRAFLNAGSVNEIVFVRGATEAINLVAKTWGDQNLQAGDEIIVSNLEHHANIVPWKQLADKKGLVLKVIPVDDDGQILLGEYAKILGPKTKLVSFTQVSNALGTVTPAKQMVEMAHSVGAKVLVDGAQSVSHLRSDVRALNCDWFVFSGHKVFGPTGIGVLFGKEELLNETQPWQGGGNMIVDVTFEQIKYHNAPSRFEAGTGNIADAVGLGAAIDYVNRIGIDLIHEYEHYLLVYATNLMKIIPGLRLIGTAQEKASVLSFVFAGYKTEEVGAALNQVGIAVRSGHHCAQPILRRFGVETTVRPSLAFYNTCSDVDLLVDTLYRLRSGHRK